MKIFIVCPDTVTGGTECLHQLGHAINVAGGSISMFYHNETIEQKARSSFKKFKLDVVDCIEDSCINLIIFPENLTKFTTYYSESKKCIFWLSVDNFYPKKGISVIRDFLAKYNLRNKRLNISDTKTFSHLSQSRYSTLFLKEHDITSSLIGDFLNDDFFVEADKAITRDVLKLNQICFNPAKGKKYIDYLSSTFSDVKFVPIVNMSRNEVIRTLSESKMYLDLGFHPGKDRIPREAAILGCCIATSKFGSARNEFDVPIPENYKFEVDVNSLNGIPELVNKVFSDFDNESLKFDSYRRAIRQEKDDFYNRVDCWLKSLTV